MQKFLQKEQLAREEHVMYIPSAKIFEIRAEQGLPKLALPTTDRLRWSSPQQKSCRICLRPSCNKSLFRLNASVARAPHGDQYCA